MANLYDFIYLLFIFVHINVNGNETHNDYKPAHERFSLSQEKHDRNGIPEISSRGIQVIHEKVYFTQTFLPITDLLKRKQLNRTSSNKEKLTKKYERCETPNKDFGYCSPLEDCDVLRKVQNKTENTDFLRSSICDNNNHTIRYCCGKYENHKYLLPKRPLPKLCGYDSLNIIKKGKILGGSPAKLGEFPWLARIIHTNREGEKTVGCEGFLIHKRFILTAAHCVKSPQMALIGNITEIQLGEHDTRTETDCNGLKCADPLQTMKVKSIIPHPEYRHNSRDHHYDIALIYMKGEVKFSDYVQPICLAEKQTLPDVFWISGWGKTENGTYSDIKLKVAVPTFDTVDCNTLYSALKVKIGQSQLCAGGYKLKDSCAGDSGGPLMFRNNETRWFAAGLVSYGRGCGLEGWPGVYTSIPYFYNWIIDEIIQIREPQLLEHRRSL